ncbi:Single-pass membrane and coiled-coil domain-containing protein 4 [Portunus trituberculatus]|uniref:Single-pass membrane and coiled-coil domain-containing protein 4 homolog n=1 Tax=Portunus trituberculatus TaxID=210409 RepID=A0A5B7CXQ4_PORTR|nr:Single-pass membrane and coiled-coil domain-containing protein 4 [Portunus trituberculatus]
MRQLKGKVKETAKERKERKKDFLANKEKAFTVALPVLGGIFILIALLVYFKTRPKDLDLDL